MPGESARINGRKGGRPLGASSKATVLARQMHEELVKRIQGEMEPLVTAWLDAAKGHYIQVTTPTGEVKVYKKAPDSRAIKDLMERVMGRPVQPIEGDVSQDIVYRIVRGVCESDTKTSADPVPFANPTSEVGESDTSPKT